MHPLTADITSCSTLTHNPPSTTTAMPPSRHIAQPAAATLRPARLVLLPALLLLAALTVLPAPCAAQPASNVSYTSLTNDLPASGSLSASATAYFQWTAPAVAYQLTTLVSVSASTGSPLLFVSFASSPAPSASSFAYSASWQTGGVVAIGQQQQPPYTLYVAVQASAWSACNYTLLVEAYDSAAAQSTAIALSSAVPLASAIAAGEYRYYTYNVSEGTDVVTVALTETYGQCWLLMSSPNATQLPTLSSYQYASSSLAFPLVALQQPAAGVWTVGVWSNQSAAFSIMAADNSTTQPMQLGVTYAGYVELRSYTYYSLYMDALQLAAYSGYLDLELYSLSGDADLCCSTTSAQPVLQSASTATVCQWQSLNFPPDDRILIPTAQLQAGTMYCGVYGWSTATYSFSAAYGSAVTLTAGETVTAESLAGSSQLYSLVFPASSALVTLSVVSDVGQTALYIGAYGQPPTFSQSLLKIPAATTQLQQLYSSILCDSDNSLVIPGSSPPLCQMQVAVITSNLTVYHITATMSGQSVLLIPGQTVQGAASLNQSSYFTFAIPDNLSNVTVVVTVTDGASGLTLAVGPTSFRTINTLWSVTQQPGSNVLVFQLDYSNPLLPSRGNVRGEYVAVLSAPAGLVTFSVLYSVTNGSVYSDTIVQLLDGVPQEAVLGAGLYSFYYFQPPPAGWPYTVTVSVTWTSGSGTLRAVASNGPQIGPLVGGVTFSSSPSLITITPDRTRNCNPTSNTTCGYSISIQSATPLQQAAQYSITVTTGHWVRTLYTTDPPQPGSVLAVADSDYWQTTTYMVSSSVNPQLLWGVSVLSGSVSVFAGNVIEPNATSAQQSWTSVTSAAVVTIPMPQGALSYLTVTCSSIDGTACQYTLQAQRYDGFSWVSRYGSVQGSPTRLLLPAGRIAWVDFPLSSYSAFAYVILQASATVGTPLLYASCITYQSGVPLPNETYSTWQALSAPLVIELYSLNVSTAGCTDLVVGVQASGTQAVMVDLSVTAAGVVQQTAYAGTYYGFTTPAYPVSYYRYTQLSTQGFVFTLANYNSTCTASQLQMVVSDTNAFPSVSDPSTYNFSATPVTLATGVTDLTVAVGNYTRPAGSLHDGIYYVAVSSTASVACQYALRLSNSWRTVPVGAPVVFLTSIQLGAPGYFILRTVPYNTSASLAVQLTRNDGISVLYVGVNNTPSPADPSSYLLSAVYNTTLAGSSGMYVAQPVYIPASACASPDAVGQSCAVVIMFASSSKAYNNFAQIQGMLSASAVQLLEQQAITTSANTTSPSSLASTTFQLSLPAPPLLVTLSVNTSSPLAVWCSYQYVTPDATYSEWQWQVGGGGGSSASDGNSSSGSSGQLSFTWGSSAADGSPLQLTNAGTQLAAQPTVCYCTVQASSSAPYSLAYSTSPLPSSSSSGHGGLSRGALVAAVVVPVVAVLLVLAGVVVVSVRRRGDVLWCCHDVLGKDARWSGRAHRQQRQRRQEDQEVDAREVSMAELSRSTRPAAAAGDGALFSEHWHSDSV